MIQISLSQPSPSNPKFSRFQSSDSFGDFEVLSDSFGDFKVLSDSFGDFEVLSDSFGDFEVLSDSFGDSISDSFGDFEVLSISKLGDSISDSFSEESEHHHLPSVRLWFSNTDQLLNGIAERFDWDKIMGGDNIIGLKQLIMLVRCVITFVSLSLHDLMGDLILVKSGAGVQQCLSFKDAEACWCHMGDMSEASLCVLQSDSLTIYKTTGDILHFKQLLNENPSLLLKLTPHENTPLHIATQFGHKNIVAEIYNRQQFLLAQPNLDGDTPLHVAARAGRISIVSFLVNELLSLSYGDIENRGNRETEILRMRNKWGNTVLHEAVRNHNLRVAEFLIKVDPELACFENNTGESPLYLAARDGMLEIVKRILMAACYSAYGGSDGQTALHATIVEGNFDAMEALVRAKPELIKEADHHGRTPLYYAASMGDHRTVQRLLQLHTDIVYMSDQDGLDHPMLPGFWRTARFKRPKQEREWFAVSFKPENFIPGLVIGFIFGLFLDLSKPIKNNNNTTPKKAANLLLGKQQRLVSTNTDEELKM
ncbi:unnamed protein product [Camellia sinensis]